jgi:integrase
MERQYRSTPAGKKYEIARPLNETSQLALWICLSTLSRIGETLMAEWKHADFQDFQQATWFIPKENVKGEDGKTHDHLVFLSPFALWQFKALHALTGSSECFSGSDVTDMHVDVKSVTKQVGDRQEMFKERAKPLARRSQDNSLVLSGGANGCWTPHDMRRTGSTLMQRLGVQDHIIDRCQNHALGGSKARRAYLHHPYDDEKKSAWEAPGAHLDVVLRQVVANQETELPQGPPEEAHMPRNSAARAQARP